MPPRKTSRKSRGSSQPWYNKKYSVGDIASAAFKGVKALQAIVNSEEMILDTNITGTTAANTPLVTHLNGIAQGDGVSGRTGNSSLMHRMHSSEYYTSAVANCLCREVLVIDKQQLADTAPVWGDLFESSTVLSLYNKLSKSRFQILEDKTFILSTAHKTAQLVKHTRPLDKHVLFNGTATSDIQKNGIYKLFIADGVVSFQANYRLFYHDN